MEHAAHKVDILDRTGNIIGQKLRREINKSHDIYHAVYALLITPQGEPILSVIPAREDLPNLYSKQFGTTMATIRRTGETALEAVRRGISRELFIDNAEVSFLGESMVPLPNNRTTKLSAFYLVAEPPQAFSVIDIDSIAVVSPNEWRRMFIEHPNEITPTLQHIWTKYQEKLPI